MPKAKENDFPSLCLKNSRGLGQAPRSTAGTDRNNGNRKFTIFAIQLLPKIKTVAATLTPDALYLRASTLGKGHECGFEIDLLFRESFDRDAIVDE